MPSLIPLQHEHLPQVAIIEAENQLSPWPTAEFARSLGSAKRAAFALCEHSRLRGYAVYSIVAEEAELLTISIAKRHQGQGLGAWLLKHSLNQLDWQRVFLEVRESNVSARALYESLGFNEVGERANYYPKGRGREHAIIYALDHHEAL